MKLTLTAKSPAGYEQAIELEADDLVGLLREARGAEMELARQGYTPTHPRPTRPAEKVNPFDINSIKKAYHTRSQP